MDRYSQTQKKYRRKYVLTFLALSASILSLSVTTFAWFIFNRNVTTTNSEVIVANQFAHEFTFTIDGQNPSDGEINFLNIYPGQVHHRNLSFSLKNTSTNPYLADIYLKTLNNNQEIAYYDDQDKWDLTDYYYYLGSQIQVTNVTLTIDGVEPTFNSGEGAFFTPHE